MASTYNSKRNVEGCHEKITEGEVCDEKICDGVKASGSDDDTEHQEVAKERNENDEAVNAHNEVVGNTEFILK